MPFGHLETEVKCSRCKKIAHGVSMHVSGDLINLCGKCLTKIAKDVALDAQRREAIRKAFAKEAQR